MKKVITNVVFVVIMTVVSIFSLSYYTLKFYPQHESLLLWAILMTIIVVTLLLGIYNAYNLNIVKKQNKELCETMLTMMHKSEKQRDEILESVFNSRDITIDTYNILQKSKGE